MKKIVEKFDRGIKNLVVLTVFLMLGFSVISIVLRWFQVSNSWIEPFVRHLVFLVAFLGATLATASSRHISIEILAKYLESKEDHKKIAVLQKILSVVTSIAVLLLLKAGYDFFLVEKEYGTEAFLSLHSSSLVAIIPFGFGLILIRTILGIFVSHEEEA